MKRSLLLLGLLLLFVVGAVAQCFEPPKPPIPTGCRDIVAECICDVTGQHCYVTWVCVPWY